MPSEEEPLIRIYEELGPNGLAELFRLRPDVTRKGLEELLGKDPEAFKRIVPQAFDQQTGLYSKIYFERVLLPASIKTANENGVPLSYVIFDLDDFHQFNDKYGRPKGDEIIELFSKLLKTEFRTKRRRSNVVDAQCKNRRSSSARRALEYQSLDYVSRIDEAQTHEGRIGGGEEFAVILHRCDENIALNRANRFLQRVREIRVPYLNQQLRITASGGIEQIREGMSIKGLIVNADVALGYSKKNGKDQVTAYSQIPSGFFTSPNPSG